MKSLVIPALLAALVPQLLAQSAGQPVSLSTLPACAQACASLVQGQNACIPPPNPTPGGVYGLQCFCGFAPLLTLGTDTPVQLCPACSTTENAAIQSWYKGTCGLPGGAANGQPGQTTTANAPTSTSSTGGTTATGQGATRAADPGNVPNVEQKDWVSTHWRWLVMVIILILGFIGLAVGGVYLRRHIHRRREARDFGIAGSRQDLETWGPGHSVHDIGTAVAAVPANNRSENEKGQATEVLQNQEVTDTVNGRSNSRRLKKMLLPGRSAK
ncbi:MAG: hypothetical protein Q9208_003134 [Pyrenodesmia sp. 3 TL-2023]